MADLGRNTQEFGARFWTAVEKGAPDWVSALRSRPGLTRVRYQDRYLHTPLTVRLFSEALAHLCREVLASPPDALPIDIITAHLATDARPGSLLWHEWQSSQDRTEVLSRLLKPLGRVALDERRRQDTQHARELTLIFEDGSRSALHLDQGFGFLGCRAEARHPFREDARRQASHLAGADFWVQARGKSFLYAHLT